MIKFKNSKYNILFNLFFSFIVFISTKLSFAGSQPELTFSSAIEVSPRTQISLYDIVEGRNMSENLVLDLKKIVIANEKTTRIEKHQLAKLLYSIRAKFILPSEIKIVRSQNDVSRMEIERKIKNHLQMDCQNCELQIQVSSVPKNLDSNWQMDLNVDLNKNTVMIPIFNLAPSEKKGWVVAQIKRFQTVPVLNRSVKFGESLTKDMFVLEKRQLQNPRGNILSLSMIENVQASRFINAGQMLTYADLKKEVVMKKGQIVKVLTGNQAFEVSLNGQVEEAGAIGEIIKIKNLDSHKIFAAKVIDRGVVRLE